jgi:predicted alpha-1,6-mannanase (GH76 family)
MALQAADAHAAGPGASPGWTTSADQAQTALRTHFWDAQTHLFHNRADLAGPTDGQFNYWWQAHALAVMAAAISRGSHVWTPQDCASFRDALFARNGHHWTNDYFDDEGWMASAMLDAGAATHDPSYHAIARELWEDIHAAWNDSFGGGIPWRKTQRDYKNAPANGPAILIGASLYRTDHKPDDLAQAVRIDAWLAKTLRDPKDGMLWDGVNRTGTGAIDSGWRFTYNQGIYIGACIELWQATHEARYLTDAERTASASLNAFFTAQTGLCPDKGTGDGGLFKGILVRHLGALARVSPTLAPRIRHILEANGARLERLQADHPDTLLPTTWSEGTAPKDLELSVQLSAVMLDEALAGLPARE